VPKNSFNAAVANVVWALQSALVSTIRNNFSAQQHQKSYFDKKRKDHSFAVLMAVRQSQLSSEYLGLWALRGSQWLVYPFTVSAIQSVSMNSPFTKRLLPALLLAKEGGNVRTVITLLLRYQLMAVTSGQNPHIDFGGYIWSISGRLSHSQVRPAVSFISQARSVRS
jgi:hypothetical protein